jgi:hypothetical protein
MRELRECVDKEKEKILKEGKL